MSIGLDILGRLGEFLRDVGETVAQETRRARIKHCLDALQKRRNDLETASPGIDTSALNQGIIEVRNILKKEDLSDEDVKNARAFCRELIGE